MYFDGVKKMQFVIRTVTCIFEVIQNLYRSVRVHLSRIHYTANDKLCLTTSFKTMQLKLILSSHITHLVWKIFNLYTCFFFQFDPSFTISIERKHPLYNEIDAASDNLLACITLTNALSMTVLKVMFNKLIFEIFVADPRTRGSIMWGFQNLPDRWRETKRQEKI